MSEQARIIAEIQELVMSILKTGTVSEAEGKRIDELETLLHQQKCFKEIDNSDHANLGEEIARLFFNDKKTEAIEKMIEYEITPDDFFGFVEYHYDDDHEDELLAEMFTDAFIADVNKDYQSRYKPRRYKGKLIDRLFCLTTLGTALLKLYILKLLQICQ